MDQTFWTKPGAKPMGSIKKKTQKPLSGQKNPAIHCLLSTSACDSPSECDEVPGGLDPGATLKNWPKTPWFFHIKIGNSLNCFLLKNQSTGLEAKLVASRNWLSSWSCASSSLPSNSRKLPMAAKSMQNLLSVCGTILCYLISMHSQIPDHIALEGPWGTATIGGWD